MPSEMSQPDWFTTHAAIITAVATILYFVTTALLWHQTKRSADAATSSAKAAKESAEVASALHRPFIGLESRATESLASNRVWKFPVELRNYGTLPATHVDASFEFHTESPPESRYHLQMMDGPTSAEIFPSSAYEIDLQPAIPTETQSKAASGQKYLVLTVRATYCAPDARKFEYKADARLDLVSKRFVVLKSDTR